MKLKMFTQDGKESGAVEVSDSVFGGKVNSALLHQVATMYAANQRQGTSQSRTRAEVSGGGAKPFRQKGTGRARAGSNASPVWVRGGTAFGPEPRNYRRRIPRGMRMLALRHALSSRAQEERMVVVESIACEPAKTKTVAKMIDSLPLNDARVLLVTDGMDATLQRCGRNIKNLSVVPLSFLNAAEVLKSDNVVLASKDLASKLEDVVTL